jgi:hypothetical protein
MITLKRNATTPSHGDHITVAAVSNPKTRMLAGMVTRFDPDLSGRFASLHPR